jgi:hypothetical protein
MQAQLGFMDLQRLGVQRQALRVGARAALRLGKFAEAEAFAKEYSTLPSNSRRPEDPQDIVAANHALMAHAIAAQGRAAEARQLLEPDLARYATERKQGAWGLTYQLDYAYALYVDALTHAGDDNLRRARLDEALLMLGSLSAEAQQLRHVRELAAWIAAARDGRA